MLSHSIVLSLPLDVRMFSNVRASCLGIHLWIIRRILVLCGYLAMTMSTKS